MTTWKAIAALLAPVAVLAAAPAARAQGTVVQVSCIVTLTLGVDGKPVDGGTTHTATTTVTPEGTLVQVGDPVVTTTATGGVSGSVTGSGPSTAATAPTDPTVTTPTTGTQPTTPTTPTTTPTSTGTDGGSPAAPTTPNNPTTPTTPTTVTPTTDPTDTPVVTTPTTPIEPVTPGTGTPTTPTDPTLPVQTGVDPTPTTTTTTPPAVQNTPEPATLTLMAFGAVGGWGYRRMKRAK